MNQCLRITFIVSMKSDIIHSLVHKYATKFSLEGMVQPLTGLQYRVMACGSKDNIDNFVDAIHEALASQHVKNVEIEPFFKNRDYRGVFRVVE